MNRRQAEILIKQLREQYVMAEKAADLTMLIRIEEQGKEVRKLLETLPKGNCYYCREREMIDGFFPFCTKECHTGWIKENVKELPKEKRRKPTIEEMRKRLLDMGKEKYIKKP